MRNASGIVKSMALLATTFAMAIAVRMPASAAGGDQIVDLQTTKGPIRMRIFYSVLPYTAGNFLDLVDSGFYNGLTFHRVENWVVQGGDPNGNGSGCATDPNSGAPKYLKFECNPNLNHNQAGMVAMARGNDFNSASCQFYILKCAMPQLNGKYCVFGRVLNGMNAVMAMQRGDKILSASVYQPPEAQPSNTGESSDTPAASGGSGFETAPPKKKKQSHDSGF